MATSKLELAVGTGQWDAGLRKAQSSLNAFIDSQGGLQQALEKENAKMGEFVQMMGKMDSVSKTAKGQMNDYKSTIEQLTLQYNRMTDAQKETIGQDYLRAIDELKKKYNDVVEESKALNDSLGQTARETKETGGAFDALKNKLTISIDAMKVFDTALSAVEGALGVVRDAFFKNEQHLDDWGRTVKSCESLYDGFLIALNNGDISGYLSNIDDIVQAAHDAYNALDELSTFNAFNQINAAAGRTTMQNAINDFRMGTGSKASVTTAADAYKANLQQRKELEQAAYEAEIINVARIHNVDPKDLRDALSGNWGHYQTLKAIKPSGSEIKFYGGGMFGGGGAYEVATPANDIERLGVALRQINDTTLQYLQGLGAAAQNTGYEIEGIDRQLIRVLNRRDAATGGGAGGGRKNILSVISDAALPPQNSIAGLTEDLRYLQQEQLKATNTDEWRTYQEAIRAVNEEIKILKGELNGPMGLASASGMSISGSINNQVADWEKQMGKKLSQGINTGKVSADGETKSISKTMSEVSSNMQTIVSGLETLGVDIPEGFSSVLKGMTAVASILSGISALVTILTAIQGTKAVPVIGWALARGGVVHAAGGYPVPGNNFSGDMVPALLNSGETVLNRAQTGLIASALQENRMSAMRLEATVSGEQIRFVLNNNGRRTGRGEYVTTRFGSM